MTMNAKGGIILLPSFPFPLLSFLHSAMERRTILKALRHLTPTSLCTFINL